MDRLEVIRQLESLREHCQSMIEAHDPESIWWGDTEALTAAIEALSLDINKTKKGDKDMTSKTKVTFETPEGSKELIGDTVICFTVDKARDFLSGKVETVEANAAYIGLEIPELVFAKTIGALVGDTVEKVSRSTMVAAFQLHEVARILEAKSKALAESRTEDQKAADFADALINLLTGRRDRL